MHWYLVPLLAVKLFAIQINNKGQNEEIKSPLSLSLYLSISLKRVILVLTIKLFHCSGVDKKSQRNCHRRNNEFKFD